MVKVKGVNIFPSQIDQLLQKVEGCTSEYQVVLEKEGSKDKMCLRVESDVEGSLAELEERVRRAFKLKIGILIEVQALPVGALPRSEKKTKRVIDKRYA